MAPSWSMPVAVVAAGGLIGLGVYLGLRTPASDSPADVVVEDSHVGPAPAPPVAVASLGPDGDARAQAQTRARAAVAAVHDTLVEACWEPSAAKVPEPTSINVGLSLAFDADGKMRGTGVVERREASRPYISDCLARKVHTLSIEGVGQPVSLEVELTLP